MQRALWPKRFQSKSAAKKAVRRKMVLVDGAIGNVSALTSGGAQVQLMARVVAGPAPGEGRRARHLLQGRLHVNRTGARMVVGHHDHTAHRRLLAVFLTMLILLLLVRQ